MTYPIRTNHCTKKSHDTIILHDCTNKVLNEPSRVVLGKLFEKTLPESNVAIFNLISRTNNGGPSLIEIETSRHLHGLRLDHSDSGNITLNVLKTH